MDIFQYVKALSAFDGYVDYRVGKNYEIVIADMSKEFLEEICNELRKYGVSCGVYASRRDRAFRLRIYGKESVDRILNSSLAPEVLLAAAIDAEGNVKKYRNQPFRTRIVVKSDMARRIEDALTALSIRYVKITRKGGRYTEIVVSGKEENQKLYRVVKIRHPQKLQVVCHYLDL